MTRAARLVAVTVLVAALSGAPTPAWATSASWAWSAARVASACTSADAGGVTVVVDFGALGGGTVVACATGLTAASRGSDALAAAGISWSPPTTQPGFVCRLAGRPSADETIATANDPAYHEACSGTPPKDAYWSYWKSSGDGTWSYSGSGLTASRVVVGGFEGWSFSTGSQVPPSVTPVAAAAPVQEPAPEQPVPEQPAPAQPAPEQPAPEQPAPEQPAPTVAPQPAPPSSPSPSTRQSAPSSTVEPTTAAPTSDVPPSSDPPTEPVVTSSDTTTVLGGTSSTRTAASTSEFRTTPAPPSTGTGNGWLLAGLGAAVILGVGAATAAALRRRRTSSIDPSGERD